MKTFLLLFAFAGWAFASHALLALARVDRSLERSSDAMLQALDAIDQGLAELAECRADLAFLQSQK